MQDNRFSPRSRERGPIEALRNCVAFATLLHSPRSRERGPIEAGSHQCEDRNAGLSPRSRERGPIEAGVSRSIVTPMAGPLRAPASAAPLKPGDATTAAKALDTLSALPRARPH